MPKLDLSKIPVRRGSGYPSPFDQVAAGRTRQALGDAGGLTQFGVNRLELAPGTWSSQRHWHSAEDEFLYVIAGEVVLGTDQGEQLLRSGDCAAFPAGAPNGHHLINKGSAVAIVLEVGGRVATDRVTYPDIDLFYDGASDAYTQRDGTPYPVK